MSDGWWITVAEEDLRPLFNEMLFDPTRVVLNSLPGIVVML